MGIEEDESSNEIENESVAHESGADATTSAAAAASGGAATWRPLSARQRRLLGVLMEKAKTTPDAYPLSLASLVAGANQKSNRYPLMNLTPEQVEDELTVLRRIGAAAEVQGSGRVPRYRHYGTAWLGVKGTEAAVMIELLLRGQQTSGDLRTRASRIEPIPDLAALQAILQSLIERKLVIALTPPGRGQLFTHNLYLPEELEALRAKITAAPEAGEANVEEGHGGSRPAAESPRRAASGAEMEAMRTEVADLKAEVAELRESLAQFQQRLDGLEHTTTP